MKKFIFLTSLLVCGSISGQSLIGAWENISPDSTGKAIRSTVIITEKYQVATWYEQESGKFISTNGGGWSKEGNTMTETIEFDSESPERVGTSVSFEIELTDTELKIAGSDKAWKRLDAGEPGALKGAWLISGRMRNGEIQPRDTDRPRKTMKILSGTRFQWIAYNTETGVFSGTGGGTYTTINGKYTENIKFFSRDDNRVGASLEFAFELKEGDWHHSGKNSRGEPLYEVWSLRK